MKRICLLTAILLTLLIFSFVMMQRHDASTITRFLDRQITQHKTPSVQYMLFDADSLHFAYRTGMRDVRNQLPVDSNTRYHLFSVTKTFTALAVLQLAQDGRLSIHDPVNKYLPAFPYPDSITILQLLNHTSGIPNPMPLSWIHTAAEHDRFDADTFFRSVFQQHPKLRFEPGSAFQYSNLGYVVLGQLIAAVTGDAYEQYVREHIIKQAGIASADLDFALADRADSVGYHKYWSVTNAVLGFMLDKQKFMGAREGRWKPFRPFYLNGAAYGGLMGTPTGVMQYAQALLKNNSALLNDQFKHILLTETQVDGKGTGMSMSWYTGRLHGHRYFAHAGGGGGYYVELRIYPELGIGSTIFFNRSGMTDQRILDKTDAYFITPGSVREQDIAQGAFQPK